MLNISQFDYLKAVNEATSFLDLNYNGYFFKTPSQRTYWYTLLPEVRSAALSHYSALQEERIEIMQMISNDYD